jgi:hypothetical protein
MAAIVAVAVGAWSSGCGTPGSWEGWTTAGDGGDSGEADGAVTDDGSVAGDDAGACQSIACSGTGSSSGAGGGLGALLNLLTNLFGGGSSGSSGGPAIMDGGSE